MQTKLLIVLVSILALAGVSHSQILLLANGSTTACSGTFYDTGGSGGAYTNNANLTFVICPSAPGAQLQVNFTTFALENSYDFLTIYNGSGTGGPTLGTYTGAAGPGLVQASNATGCLTFVFTSDGSVTAAGWAGTISCTSPCQSIVPSVISNPPISGGTYINVCQGDVVAFTGSGAYPQNSTSYTQSNATSTFNWTFSDGGAPSGQVVNHTYTTPGIFQVDLVITDINGCTSTIDIDLLVRVSDDPVFTGSFVTNPVICLGETNTLTGAVTPTQIALDCTPPVAGTTFLPDGSGVSYSTNVAVDCFSPGQTMTSAADLNEICITMEHSYLGDLELEIQCPNGQTAILHAYPGGAGTYLGSPFDPGPGGPGTGWQYCFDMSASTLLVNGPTTPSGNPLGNAIVAGSYLPVGNFSSLIGCPLNGNWTINITDNLASDDGYIFGWGLDFNSSLAPSSTQYTPAVVSEGWQADPTITSTAGNTITVTPTVAGPACYTYQMTDEFGCDYDTTICFTVVPPSDPSCPNCYIATFSANIGFCQPDNTFTVDGDFTYQDNPGTGNLVVEVTNGSGTYTQIFTPPYTDGQVYTYNISGIPSDGTALTVTIYFVNDLLCTQVINSTSPASCACNADIGTFTVATTGTQNVNDFVLCFGDDLDITANGDYTAPGEATNPPGPPYTPGISWLVYSCPPTIALTPDPVLTIPNDPCLLGIVSNTNLNETNDMFWINAYPPGTFTDNIVYFLPITMYSLTNSPMIYSYTNTTMPCYETGPIYSVQYVPQVTQVSVQNCAAGTVTTTVSGGQPAIDGSLFTGTNLLPTTASFSPGTASNGGNIVVTGLVDGDAYSYDIVDVNGCPVTITGTFVGLEDPAFSYPQTAYCQSAANPSPTITGDAGGTFSSTAGLSINTSTGLINLAASTAGTYTITYQTPDPVCFATSTFILTINPLPTVTIAGTASACVGTAGPTVTLTGSNGTAPYTFTYNINGGANQTIVSNGAGVATITALTGTAGSFNYNLVSVQDASSTACSQAQVGTATITINPNPTPIINGASTYCTGTSSTLSISAPFSTYLWSTGAVTSTANVTDADNPITATVTNAQGCSGTSAVFTVTENSVITYNTTVEICQGFTATIHGNVESVAGTYSQTYVLPTGCDSTSNVTLVVHALPIIDAGVDQTACFGTATTLNASGAPTIVWNNGVTNGVPFNQAVGTTTYTATGTDGFGCVNTDMVNVTINPIPTATIAGTVTVCQNAAAPTITFTGANGTAPYTFTYNINGTANQTIVSNGAGVASIVAPTGTAGTFNYNLLSVSDASATPCSQAQVGIATVTVNPLPTATIAGTIAVCQNAAAPTITFTGANGTAPYTFTYNINGGANQTVVSVGTIATLISPTGVVGTFNYNLISVSDVSSTACSQAQVGIATVTVNPLPTATIAGTVVICQNTAAPTITFTGANGTAPYTFTYNINGGANQTIVSAGVTATVSAPTGAPGTFNYNLVSVSDASSTGCSQAQVGIATVTVNPFPTATISGTATVCQNGAAPTITFTGANGTSPYTFTYNIAGGANQTVVSAGTTATVTAPTGTAGTFDYNLLSVSDASTTACSQLQVGAATVIVNPLPTATIAGTVMVCQNDTGPTITFTGGNGTAPYTFTYNINGGANQTVVSVGTTVTVAAPTGTVGTFDYNLLSVSDASATSCSQAQVGTATVTVNPNPTASISGTTAVCMGDPDPTITLTGADGTAPYTFTYNLNNTGNQTITSTGNTATITVPTIVAGLFNFNLVSVSDVSATGCSQVQAGTATITVNDLPNVFAGNDFIICEVEQAVLTGSGASAYIWDQGVSNGVAFTPGATSTYNVIGTDANGCVNTDDITITIEPLPLLSFIGDNLSGCAPLTVTFNNTNPGAMVNCIWTLENGTVLNGCGSVTTTFNSPGTFDVTLTTTSANGCTANATYTDYIYVEADPIASFSPSSTLINNFDPQVYFDNTSTGAVTYDWNFGDGSQMIHTESPIYAFNEEQPGIYNVQLIAYSPLGCSDTAYATIQLTEEVIFYVPNTFTPDDDDYNPTFQPVFTAGYDPYDFTLLIFNRWGEILFESHNADIGWDGTYGGGLVQDGTYTWKIEFKTTANDERKLVVGHVNILR